MRASAVEIKRASWQTLLQDSVRAALIDDRFWAPLLHRDACLHLAVLVEPYLSLLLSGEKTMESRFSMTRRTPFRCVKANDILILKRSAGPIAGICRIADVDFYHLDPASLSRLREEYHDALAIQDQRFWDRQSNMRYATLMRISNPTPLSNVRCGKRDQRGWVTLTT